MLLNAHIPNDFQIVGWLKRGIKRERNQIEREDERSAGRGRKDKGRKEKREEGQKGSTLFPSKNLLRSSI